MSASVSCPTCGNVNPPGAKFCARCGTQLDRIVGSGPTPVAASPAPGGISLPPPPGSGGEVTITHRGRSHGVGYGEGFYGVWSLEGGAPLQRFERTDAGWGLAWTKFQELEARGGGKRGLFRRGS